MIRRLFQKLAGEDGLPVVVKNSPGIWVLASQSKAQDELLIMLDNLSGDTREGIELEIGRNWSSAKAYRIGEDGTEVPLSIVDGILTVDKPLEVMVPEFILLRSATQC